MNQISTRESKPMDQVGPKVLLEQAMQSYLRQERQLGHRQMCDIIRIHSDLRCPHLLMRAIRACAYRLIDDPSCPSEPSVRLMRALLEDLAGDLEALRPFAAGELSDWLLTAAYHEHSRGRLALTRSYIVQAIRVNPGLLADRPVVSLLLQSTIGSHAVRTYRTLRPRGLARSITLAQRQHLIRRYVRTHDVIKVHIGCGDNLLEGWLNADLSEFNRGGVTYVDAAQPLPFGTNSVDFVFSEHLIEHMSYADGVAFLRECHRVLRPGGVCRTATPSLRFLSQLYSDQTGSFAPYVRWSAETWSADAPPTPAVVINSLMRSWGHKFIYDFDTLSRLLSSLGFAEANACQVGQSDYRELQGLERHGDHIPEAFNLAETMVIEATSLQAAPLP